MESSLLGKPELSLDRVFTHKSEHFTGGQTDEFDQREWVMATADLLGFSGSKLDLG